MFSFAQLYQLWPVMSLTGHCDGWLWTVSWMLFVWWGRPGTAQSLVSHPSWAGSNWGGILVLILYSNYHGHSALQTRHQGACAKLSLTWLLVVICSVNSQILTTSRLFYFSPSTSVIRLMVEVEVEVNPPHSPSPSDETLLGNFTWLHAHSAHSALEISTKL